MPWLLAHDGLRATELERIRCELEPLLGAGSIVHVEQPGMATAVLHGLHPFGRLEPCSGVQHLALWTGIPRTDALRERLLDALGSVTLLWVSDDEPAFLLIVRSDLAIYASVARALGASGLVAGISHDFASDNVLVVREEPSVAVPGVQVVTVDAEAFTRLRRGWPFVLPELDR